MDIFSGMCYYFVEESVKFFLKTIEMGAGSSMMQSWFKQAKLGIFIHWGLYSVEGVHESWAMPFAKMSCEEYYKQKDHFTAEYYDPKEWAEYFKEAGANYVVLTTKHHEGFCLFDTEYTDLNVVKATPCGKDLVGPYVDALREQGIKVGLYFTNTDWADDDHMRVILDLSQEELDAMKKVKTHFFNQLLEDKQLPDPEKKEELDACWARFMTRYKGEIKELMTRYMPDILWTDGMLTRTGFSWECKEVKQMIEQINPVTIVNGRLGDQGDYVTPECYIPLRPLEGEWELCITMNSSWGYQPVDRSFKNVKRLVRIFVECISKGGNLLLSFGPDGKGRIQEEVINSLKEMGQWTHKYAEAIYPTGAGLDPAFFLGGTTLSQDKQTLYLFAYDCSTGQLMFNGIRNNIKKITSMVNGQELTYRIDGGSPGNGVPGFCWIDVPADAVDDVCTVIKVELEGPIDIVDINANPEKMG